MRFPGVVSGKIIQLWFNGATPKDVTSRGTFRHPYVQVFICTPKSRGESQKLGSLKKFFSIRGSKFIHSALNKFTEPIFLGRRVHLKYQANLKFREHWSNHGLSDPADERKGSYL